VISSENPFDSVPPEPARSWRLWVLFLLVGIALATARWFLNSPTEYSSYSSARELSDYGRQMVLLCSVTGFAAMSAIEVFKRLLRLRGWFHQAQLSRYLGEITIGTLMSDPFSTPPPRSYSAAALNGSVRRRVERLDVPLEQLMAQLGRAVDAAFDQMAQPSTLAESARHEDRTAQLLLSILCRRDVPRDSAVDAVRIMMTQPVRLRGDLQAALDGFQIRTGNIWRWRIRFSACGLSALTGLLVLFNVPAGSWMKAITIAGTFVLGGFFAGLARDLTAGVERWRR
jgi:hypothetical protein